MKQQTNLTQMKYNICYNNMRICNVAFNCVKIMFHEPLGGDTGEELIELIQKANEEEINKWDIIQYLEEKKIQYDLKFRYLKNLSLQDNLHNRKSSKPLPCCININKMAYPTLLLGISDCCIESYPGAGHNYQAVVDAIHNCYARNHAAGIDIGYKEGLETMIPTGKDIQKILDYQKKKEQEGTAQFYVDV